MPEIESSGAETSTAEKHLCQLLSRSEMLVAILSTACAQHIVATNIVLEYNERCNIIHTEFFWIGLVQI